MRVKVQKIVIIKSGNFGDMIVSIPALRIIRENFPTSRVDFIWAKTAHTKVRYADEVLGGLKLLDGIYEFNLSKNLILRIANLIKLMFFIIYKRPNLGIILEPEYWPAKRGNFLKLCGINFIISPKGEKRHIDRIGQDKLKTSMNVVESICATLIKNGLYSKYHIQTYYKYEHSIRDLRYAKILLGEEKIDGKIIIGVAVGTNMMSKKWPLDRYKIVIKKLIEDHNIFPIYFGGDNDHSSSDMLVKELGVGLNLAGITTIPESIAIIKHCSIYLGNDTGPMHMASIAGIPCVAIFSSIDMPGRWEPYGIQEHRVIREDLDCSGCMLAVCAERGGECLDKISVDRVYKECKFLIDKVNGK